MNRTPDVEVIFKFNGTRTNPAVDGYRPAHLITDSYLTTGVHHYYKMNAVPPNGTATGTITFLSPEVYPHCLWIGKKINIQEGARVVAGGERITDGELGKGCFVRPTLIVDATNDMRVAREEIFGPVAVVIKFHSEEEVIEQANDSLYGLGGGVFTQNLNRAIRVARAIETGRMWVNTYNSIPAGAPFGGYKQSGIGRETHKVILEHYTQMKNIIINLSDKPSGFYNLD